MRVLLFYKSASDHARTAREFAYNLKHQTGYDLEEIDPDTREGDSLAKTYDIVDYPTVLVLNSEGIMQSMWTKELPPISEVGYYASLE